MREVCEVTFCRVHRLNGMRLLHSAAVVFLFAASAWPKATELTTTTQILDRYEHALGGAQAIQRIQSLTVRGEMEKKSMAGKAKNL